MPLPGNVTVPEGQNDQLGASDSIAISSATYTVPAYVRSFSLRSTAASLTLTLPPILFRGQELNVTIYNNSGGAWATTQIVGGIPTGLAGMLNGAIKCLRFLACDWDKSGSYTWMLMSERG